MSQSNQGNVAVVTGAASGIGRAVATRAVEEGMRVAAVDVNAEGLTSLAAEHGDAVVPLPTDLTEFAAAQATADRVFAELGDVHLISTNAGVASVGTTWQTPLEEWHRIFDINLFGMLHTIQAFLPGMLERGTEATIVNTASMVGLQSAAMISAYTSSKHAVIGMSECLAGELQFSGSNIHISVLCPGRVATPLGAGTDDEKMIEEIDDPMNVPVQPEYVAGIIFDTLGDGHGYLFTHKEAPAAVQERTDAIIATAFTPATSPQKVG
jgi:NAD(P)-dependent dehydrogenase (short-subunit alcohol dehydrogenase family)